VRKDTVIVTGAAGLVGSETARRYASKGFRVIGIDNDSRKTFFGENASTQQTAERLTNQFENFSNRSIDIRDERQIRALFEEVGGRIHAVIHTAAQPSHDWAATDPLTDFDINARATLILLNAFREFAAQATFILMSTNKVYGDWTNSLNYTEGETRYRPIDSIYQAGFNESIPIDGSTHSLFGVSKASADLMVQEFGRYFGMSTVVFRGGCLTGPGHAGAPQHGFLSYLTKSLVRTGAYGVIGYGGKQVRDNLHVSDLVDAFELVCDDNPTPGSVFNIGGGVDANVSVLEACSMVAELLRISPSITIQEQHRTGDHKW
jgi:CDP-paratose 2-epimerase